MKDVFSAMPLAFRHLFKDPVNFILFLIPGILAVVLYLIAGAYALKNGLSFTEVLINKYVISKNANLIIYYLVSGLMTFLFFILVSWTFIIIIGILAAPFNSVISDRIEKKMRGDLVSKDQSKGISSVFTGIGRTLWNEVKKLFIILLFTVLAMALNFVPILLPVAMILLALIMSAQFLDFSWSRHDLSAGQCVKDITSHLFSNIVSGLMFLLLVAVPIINALVPALATSYYTVLWIKRQQKLL